MSYSQAQARAHRIGQKKNVKVYRLLTRKTYEMHLFNVASLKLGLDYALMHNLRSQYGPLPVSNQREIGEDGGEKTISSSDNLSKKEIENLLKHGAYDMFREEKDGQGEEASKRFCEEDIDSILQRSTLIVHKGGCAEVHEDGTVVPGTGGALNSFAKASFVSSKEGDTNDVALDDPLFWEKVVGVSNGDMGNSSSEEYEDLEGNTQRRKMNRKRRCARIIGSYKEVGMNFQELSGISTKGAAFDSNEDDAVSNGSDDDDRGARKGRSNSGNKKKREIHLPRTLAECSNQDRDDNEIEREKMTAEAYDAIATCLGVYGYGSWVVIANALEHRFSSNQIARAGRAIVLQVFKNACLTAGVAAETEEGETRPEIQAIVSVSKVQAKALCSSLYLFVHLADMMTSYVVSNNLRESHDIPDDCVLLQWVVDRIVRLKTPVNNMASFFDTSPQPIFYQSVPSFRALIEQTLEEYVSNIASNASPFPAFNFSTTFTAEAAATQLNDLKVPVGFTGSKLKLTALESLFDLMIMNRISEGKLMLAAPPSGPAAATTAIETPLAALLRKSTMFVDFFKAERLVLPEKAQELAWWTDLHDSLMLVCLFECGWSTQSFKTLIIPIFEAVGEHLGPQCFAIDIKIMRGLMGIIFKRVKDVLSATKTPSKRELPRQQTTCLLKALQNYGIPFTGLYQRQSFLPPSVLLEPTAAVEVQVKAATDTAMHIADDDRMEIVKNFPKDFPDRPRLWRPYPATAVIPGECSQLDPLKHPRTNAIFGLPPSPLMTWEIVAAHANGAMKADQIEECTLYLLSHAREIMQYSATSSDQGVFNSVLGPLKPKVVKETIVKIETIWTIQSILMLDNVDSGASGCVAHTEEFDLSVITKDLCPEHQELANIFSQRLKKLNGSWPGFMDVRLLRMLLYCGCDLVAVSKHKVHLLKEEERGDISIPTAQVLLQRAISIVDLVGRPYVPPVVREPPKLSNAFQKMSSIDAVQRAWPMAISQSRPAVSQTLPICEEKSLPQYSSSSTGVVMQRLNSETAPIIPSYPPVAHLTPGLIPGTTTMDNTSAAIKADKKVDLSAAKKPHQMSLMMSFSKAKLKQDEKANIRDEVAAAINAAAVAAQKKLSGCDAAVMSPDSSVLLVALE